MSDTLLNLTNRALRETGDAKEVTTISGSLIAERITSFLNQVLGDLEQAIEAKPPNNPVRWPFLRVDSTGTGDGTNDTFDFTGSENVREDGPIDVWIPTLGKLHPLKASDFDAHLALGESGNPEYFQIRVASTGKAEIQIYPLPANGLVINMSAYKRASRFDSTVDSGTTEFDDDILMYGLLMHLDAYDGLDRGYASLFKNHLISKGITLTGYLEE